jgi:hypothetical protein
MKYSYIIIAMLFICKIEYIIAQNNNPEAAAQQGGEQ